MGFARTLTLPDWGTSPLRNAECGMRNWGTGRPEWGETSSEADDPSSVAALRRVEGNEGDRGTWNTRLRVKVPEAPSSRRCARKGYFFKR